MSAKLKDMEKMLKGLGNRRRLAIVQFLKKNKAGSVIDISDAIRLSYKSTSHHLRLMHAAGLLVRDQPTAAAAYSLAPANDRVLQFLIASL